MQKQSRSPLKYRDCERMKVAGGAARKLTARELAEWKERLSNLGREEPKPIRLEEETA